MVTGRDRPEAAGAGTPEAATEAAIEDLIGALTVEEKASLTAGVGLWYLPPVARLGIPALKVSDGPSGVRGDSLIGRRSLSLPCGMTIGSTWNPDLVERLGLVLAAEARSKGVHVLLGPTVCIVRTPLAGRTFESFSEDPLLTSRLAAAYITGVQGGGVACCVKHFACNDQEYERMTISAEVDERTLHEIHLPAFEAAVGQAGVWAVMTAYNRVNGTYCGEHPELIGRILRDEWAFDGLVMSDWFGTHSTAPAAAAGLDLEMPGPSAWFGPTLAEAVRSGEVGEPLLDEKARHLLRLMARVGIIGGDPAAGRPEREEDDPAQRRVARQVVAEGTVLLHNDGLLPLDPAAIEHVAVIGPNAAQLEAGGGSSEVTPHRRRRLVDALAERLPGTTLVHESGCRIDRDLPTIDMRLVSPGGSETGLRLDYFDNPRLDGSPQGGDTAHLGRLTWVGTVGPELPAGTSSVRIRATFTPDASGRWQCGLESAGRSVLRLDGAVVVDNSAPTRGRNFYGAGSALVHQAVELEAGRPYALEVDLWPRTETSPILGVRIVAARPGPPDEFERAVAAARRADVAVVVVGSNGGWESEGFDRPDLSLPGRQRELVEAIIAANPRTVVVVNAGSPVELPWATRAGAVLMAWYPGEEGADAIADMLIGLTEPSGRLPVSFPHRIEDTPAHGHYPGAEGKVDYGEGIFVGYRHYETAGVEPLFPFGHGLSYTTFALGQPEVSQVPGRTSVTVGVTNTGGRRGAEVVQVYARAEGSAVPRPDRELVAFAKLELDAGESRSVSFDLDDQSFAHWDSESHGWVTDPGRYTLLIGTSSRRIQAEIGISLPFVSSQA
jgi:beta-glucosidase